MPGNTTRRLTDLEKDEIISLRLQGTPWRPLAASIPTTTATAQKVWKEYIKEEHKVRLAEIEQERSELIIRQDQIARNARRQYQACIDRVVELTDEDGNVTTVAAPDHQAARAYLAEERMALKERARLQGLETIGVSVDVSKLSDAELKKLLGED